MEVLNRQAEVNFQVLSGTDGIGGASGRPHTAMASSERRTLGSMCPVIIKHEFPNEQKHYIDNVGSEMSATKKRFIYDRPNTAKLHRSGGASSAATLAPASAGPNMQRSMSGQTGFAGSAFLANRSASHAQLASTGGSMNQAIAKPSSAAGLNSADLYSKLLEGQKIKKESRFVIKPARKLNTFQIHSALFNIKKQKEELDGKIRDLEDLKKHFTEQDFFLMAKSGAVDYLLNNGGMEAPVDTVGTAQLLHHPDQSQPFLSFESETEQADNQIISLVEINTNNKNGNGKRKPNLNPRPMSSVPQKKASFSTLNQKSRASTAKPNQAKQTTNSYSNNNNNNNGNVNQSSSSSHNAAGVSANSRDQIEMLRGESRDESRDQLGSFDLELLGGGGAMRVFQGHERNQVKQWGENIDQPGSVKDSIENIGENLASINILLGPKRASTAQQTNPQQQAIGAIQEEEDDDLHFQAFDEDNITNTHNNQNNFFEVTEENNRVATGDLKNLPYEQYLEQTDSLSPGIHLQLNHYNQQFSQNGQHHHPHMHQHYHSQTNIRPSTASSSMQFTPTGIFPSFSKKKSSMKRVQSAKISHGPFRPFSGAPGSSSQIQTRPFSSMVSPLGIDSQQFSAMHSRPQTSTNRMQSATLSVSGGGQQHQRASHHALMSYGNVQVIKESIKRNFDHLEILADSELQERAKKSKAKRVLESKQDWQNLKVSGSRLPISSDNLIDLVKQTQEAIQKYQSVSSHQSNSTKVMQVSLSGQQSYQYHQQQQQQQQLQQQQQQQQAPAQFFGSSSLINIPDNSNSNPNYNINVRGATEESQQYEQQQQKQYQPDNQSLTYSQSIAQYQQEGLDSLDQLHSTISRGTVDLNSVSGNSKSLRPSTAKPSQVSGATTLGFGGSAGGNAAGAGPGAGAGGSKRMLNVPIVESLAYRPQTDDSNSHSSNLITSFQGLHLTQQQSHVLHFSEQLQAAAQNYENIQALSLLQSQSNQYTHHDHVANDPGVSESQQQYISQQYESNFVEEQKEDISINQDLSAHGQQQQGIEEELAENHAGALDLAEESAVVADDYFVDSNDRSEDADQFENLSYATSTKKSKFSNRPTTAYQQ